MSYTKDFYKNIPSERCQVLSDSESEKRSDRSGIARPISEFSDGPEQGGRQPMRASAKPEARTPCRPLSAVQVSIGNFFLRNCRQFFGCEPFSTLVSTMPPCRPHPACSGLGNFEACACRNSGQIKVAAPRAAHLNLSPRCGDLAGEPSLSSHIDALVPAALRSGDWRESDRMAKGKIENSVRFSMLNRLKLKTWAGY
jgi:hypothetical protein